DGIAVAIAVAVEKPLHHLLRRRDDRRKLERRRLRPRALLGDAEPTAHLCSDRPRHGANAEHRNVALEEARRHSHTLDRGRRAGKRSGEHVPILLRELLTFHREADTPTVLNAAVGRDRAQRVSEGVTSLCLIRSAEQGLRIDPLDLAAWFEILRL